jgi:hypothetical protein
LEAFVGKYDLGVDAVAREVTQPVFRVASGFAPLEVFAVEGHGANAERPKALGHLDQTVGTFFVAGKTFEVFLVHPREPEVGGLVGVTIGGDHEVLVRVARPRRAPPALVTRALASPEIVGVLRVHVVHGSYPSFGDRSSEELRMGLPYVRRSL